MYAPNPSIIIINTGYQKLPFGSGDYPDKLLFHSRNGHGTAVPLPAVGPHPTYNAHTHGLSLAFWTYYRYIPGIIFATSAIDYFQGPFTLNCFFFLRTQRHPHTPNTRRVRTDAFFRGEIHGRKLLMVSVRATLFQDVVHAFIHITHSRGNR